MLGAPWHKHAVIYQIYPLTFAAPNGGYGTLQGVLEHLDHVLDMGVDALWFSPFFTSPLKQGFGYNISDYNSIEPTIGTMAQFEEIIGRCKAKGVKVLLDLVMNHTADEHRWFQASRDPQHPLHEKYKDFYVWADPAPGGGPPNNWVSITDRQLRVSEFQPLEEGKDYRLVGNKVTAPDGTVWYENGDLTVAARQANIRVIRQYQTGKLTVQRSKMLDPKDYQIVHGSKTLESNHSEINESEEVIYRGQVIFANGQITEEGLKMGLKVSHEPSTAWKLDEKRGQYYLHNFASNMPDLNFRSPLDTAGKPVYASGLNEPLMQEMENTVRFWLEKGVDGFRLDAIPYYVHGDIRQNVADPFAAFPVRHQHAYNQPETVEVLRRLRAVGKEYGDIFFLGEGMITPPEKGDHVPQAVEKSLAIGPSYSVSLIASEALDALYAATMSGSPDTPKMLEEWIREITELFSSRGLLHGINWASENHDMGRVIDRWRMEVHTPEQRREAAKTILALTLSLPGSACIFQGQELGLPKAEVLDMVRHDETQPICDSWNIAANLGSWETARGPIPWKKDQPDNAWVKMPEDYRNYAAELQRGDSASVLTFTKEFLTWRKQQKPMLEGNFSIVPGTPEGVVMFVRSTGEQQMLCAFNLSGHEVKLDNIYDKGGHKTSVILPPFGRCLTSELIVARRSAAVRDTSREQVTSLG